MQQDIELPNSSFWQSLELGILTEVCHALTELPALANEIHPTEKLSAFEMALAAGYQKVASALMSSPNFDVDLTQHNPLRIAVELGYLELAESLLQQGANPNYRPRGMSSALLLCLDREYFDLAQLMVLKGAEVDIRNDQGWTPLIWASVKGRTRAVEFLLGHGAALHVCNNDGWNAITGAYFKKQYEVVKVLSKAGAVFTERFKQAVLLSAFDAGENELVLELLEDGVCPDTADLNGESILAKATNKGVADVLEALLRRSNVNVKDASGVPVLALFAQHGETAWVELALSQGADVNLPAKTGDTALILACRYNQIATVKVLLDHGANINATNKQGVTALMVAAEIGSLELVKLLMLYKPNQLLKDNMGRTAKTRGLDNMPRIVTGSLKNSPFLEIVNLLTLPGH